jgi:hypothetical protein
LRSPISSTFFRSISEGPDGANLGGIPARWKSVGRHRGSSKTPNDIGPVMKKAFDTAAPVIVGAQVDYTNHNSSKW